jgi:hypothetical protein
LAAGPFRVGGLPPKAFLSPAGENKLFPKEARVVKRYALVPLLLAVVGACVGSVGEGAPAPGVQHPYLPLVPGWSWTYEGDEDGVPRREEVNVEHAGRVIDGILCTTVVQRVFLDGALVEETVHWYAEDTDGNVWQFGESSVEIAEDGTRVPGDAWEAGIDGAEASMVLAREPRVGDVYVDAGDGDELLVLSVGATATVPFGTFEGCLEVQESNPEDPDDADLIIYAPGMGIVSESAADSRIELVAAGGP